MIAFLERRRRLLIMLALAIGIARPAGAAERACLRQEEARLPVRLADNVPLVSVTVNRNRADLILDTGAEETVLSRSAASRFGLQAHYEYPRRLRGVAGAIISGVATTRRFAVGTLTLPGFMVLIGSLDLPHLAGTRPDGLLGADFFANFDMELNLARGRLRLYPRGCLATQPLWSRPYTAIQANRSLFGHLFFPVELDSRRLYAFIDTGAQISVVDRPAVLALGVTPAEIDRGPVAVVRGAGSRTIAAHLHRFAQLRIGNMTIRHPIFAVAQLGLLDADIILGDDFLKSWRVWFSYAPPGIFLKGGRLAPTISPRGPHRASHHRLRPAIGAAENPPATGDH
jgi:predicted aspartyl protease